MSNETGVKHNEKKRRFELDVDGHTGYVEYEVADDGVMVFTHTIVPSEIEGRGVAGKVVREALEYAKANDKRIFAECAYVDAYLKKHTEYADMVDE